MGFVLQHQAGRWQCHEYFRDRGLSKELSAGLDSHRLMAFLYQDRTYTFLPLPERRPQLFASTALILL